MWEMYAFNAMEHSNDNKELPFMQCFLCMVDNTSAYPGSTHLGHFNRIQFTLEATVCSPSLQAEPVMGPF